MWAKLENIFWKSITFNLVFSENFDENLAFILPLFEFCLCEQIAKFGFIGQLMVKFGFINFVGPGNLGC